MAFGENGGKKPPQQERLETEVPREWNYALFRHFILDACKTDTETGIVHFDDLPDVIDLGTFHRKTQECVQETMNEGEGREHGSQILFDPQKERILVKKTPNEGEETHIKFRLKLGFHYAEMQRRQRERRTIGIMHSHPANVTFSPDDIAGFLANRDQKILTVGLPNGITDILISTPETKWIVDKNALQRRDISAIQRLVAKWEALLERVVRKQYADRASYTIEEQRAAEDEIFGKLAQYASVNYQFGYYRSDESGIAQRVLPPKKRK